MSQPMTITPEQLAAWKALAEQATPGPWKRQIGNHCREVHDAHGSIVSDSGPENGSFIAASRTALPALIAECERLRAQRDDCYSKDSAKTREINVLVPENREQAMTIAMLRLTLEKAEAERDALRAAARQAREALNEVETITTSISKTGIIPGRYAKLAKDAAMAAHNALAALDAALGTDAL